MHWKSVRESASEIVIEGENVHLVLCYPVVPAGLPGHPCWEACCQRSKRALSLDHLLLHPHLLSRNLRVPMLVAVVSEGRACYANLLVARESRTCKGCVHVCVGELCVLPPVFAEHRRLVFKACASYGFMSKMCVSRPPHAPSPAAEPKKPGRVRHPCIDLINLNHVITHTHLSHAAHALTIKVSEPPKKGQLKEHSKRSTDSQTDKKTDRQTNKQTSWSENARTLARSTAPPSPTSLPAKKKSVCRGAASHLITLWCRSAASEVVTWMLKGAIWPNLL